MRPPPRAVAILGLSGYEPQQPVLERAQRYFEAHGASVLLLPAAHASSLRFAASPAERLAALDQALSDPHVDLVIALRGGYGLSQLLAQIDFDRVGRIVAERNVMFCGYSDFTAFSLALLARTGAISYSGPSAVCLGAERLDEFAEDRFWQAQRGHLSVLEFDSDAADLKIEGRLWGGNLSMVMSLLGTPFFPHIDDGVLFLEDVNEHPYRIERMLLQLDDAGVLKRQRAVLLGGFTNYRLSEYDRGYDLPAVFAHLRERGIAPLVSGLPIGHVAHKATLPIGAWVRLDVTAGRAALTFPP